jgi:hypothetical protein
MATGGLRYWNDGRDVPDVMLALFDYPKTASHPPFTLSLKVNFAEGGGDNQAFRFVGPEGTLTIAGGAVTVTKRPRASEPGHTSDTFAKATQQAFMKEYRDKYPEQAELRPTREEVFAAPPGYNEGLEHFRTFFDAVRTRRAVVEDAAFGYRAAAPALLTNESYFEGKPVGWDPSRMQRAEFRRDSQVARKE